MRSTYILVGLDTYVGRRVIDVPYLDVTERGRAECPSSGRTQPRYIALTSHRVYGVGGPHKTNTLITVSVLLLPRLPNQQVI